MAPIRRYLRITKYSVLEVRIYLENPADANRWLLHPKEPALPRVIEAVRPLVLPKLKEENLRAKKGGKKKGVKDVVSGEDFDVSIFLTELSTPHSLMIKQKMFIAKTSNELGGTKDAPMEVGGDDGVVLREESDDEGLTALGDIPLAVDNENGKNGKTEDDAMSVSEGSEDTSEPAKSPTKPRSASALTRDEDGKDDKKKLGFNTTYDGFRIYGRILCLVVKRNASKGKEAVGGASQVMMEEWIASTQTAAENRFVDD